MKKSVITLSFRVLNPVRGRNDWYEVSVAVFTTHNNTTIEGGRVLRRGRHYLSVLGARGAGDGIAKKLVQTNRGVFMLSSKTPLWKIRDMLIEHCGNILHQEMIDHYMKNTRSHPTNYNGCLCGMKFRCKPNLAWSMITVARKEIALFYSLVRLINRNFVLLCLAHKINASIAQLVEHLPFKQRVEGSSPSRRTKDIFQTQQKCYHPAYPEFANPNT